METPQNLKEMSHCWVHSNKVLYTFVFPALFDRWWPTRRPGWIVNLWCCVNHCDFAAIYLTVLHVVFGSFTMFLVVKFNKTKPKGKKKYVILSITKTVHWQKHEKSTFLKLLCSYALRLLHWWLHQTHSEGFLQSSSQQGPPQTGFLVGLNQRNSFSLTCF